MINDSVQRSAAFLLSPTSTAPSSRGYKVLRPQAQTWAGNEPEYSGWGEAGVGGEHVPSSKGAATTSSSPRLPRRNVGTARSSLVHGLPQSPQLYNGANDKDTCSTAVSTGSEEQRDTCLEQHQARSKQRRSVCFCCYY